MANGASLDGGGISSCNLCWKEGDGKKAGTKIIQSAIGMVEPIFVNFLVYGRN